MDDVKRSLLEGSDLSPGQESAAEANARRTQEVEAERSKRVQKRKAAKHARRRNRR